MKIKTNTHGYLIPTIRNFYYPYYKETTKQPVDVSTYRAVIESIFKKVWSSMVKDLWVFRAPNNLGRFYICESFSSNGFFVDFQKSREKGKRVENYNFHTNGKRFFIKWNLGYCKVKNNNFYYFVPYRGKGNEEVLGKRGLAYWIKKCSRDPLLKDFVGHIV